jgi:hypothetical protein
VLFFAVDWLSGMTLPALWRGFGLIAWLLLAAVLLSRFVLGPWRGNFSTNQLAALLELRYPELAERLTTSVELADRAQVGSGSPALIAMLLQETEQRTAPLPFHAAVSPLWTRRIVAGAVLCAFLVVVPAVISPRQYANLAQRLFLPMIAAPADLSIAIVPGDTFAAMGRMLEITAKLTPRDETIPLPERVTMEVKATTSPVIRVEMLSEGQKNDWSVKLPLKGDCSYRVIAANSSSNWFSIRAVEPVELAADSPEITVNPPLYARSSFESEKVIGLGDFSALQFSAVDLSVQFTAQAKAATLELRSSEGERILDVLPLRLTDDGKSAKGQWLARQSGQYRLILDAERGIRTVKQGGSIIIRADQPPAFVRMISKEVKAARLRDRLPIEAVLRDDIGIGGAVLEVRRNQDKSAEEPFSVLGTGREVVIQRKITLGGKVEAGDTLSYRIRFFDNRPPEYGGAQTRYFPESGWATVQIVEQEGSPKENEIQQRKRQLDQKIDDLKADLKQQQRQAMRLRNELRDQQKLDEKQRRSLEELLQRNRETQKTLRDLARDAQEDSPKLAQKAKKIADDELRKTETAFQDALDEKKGSENRTQNLKNAEDQIDAALGKLDSAKQVNEEEARAQLDEAKIEELANRQEELAEKLAELAEKPNAKDAEKLRREQEELAQELEKQTKQNQALQKALEEARAEQLRQAGDRAKELAQAQRDLDKAAMQTEDKRSSENEPTKDNPAGKLAEEQAKIAKDAEKLAKEVAKEQGEKAKSSEKADRVREEANETARELQSGALERARDKGKQTAKELDQLTKELAKTKRNSDAGKQDTLEQARKLAQRQEAVNKQLDPLAKDTNAQRAQQQARQQQLADEAKRLQQELQQSKMTESAAKSAAEGEKSMRAAHEGMQKGDNTKARQQGKRAAEALERAGQEVAKGVPKADPAQGKGQSQAGRAVQQAKGQMNQARDNLDQGKNADARQAMQDAAQQLQTAARAMREGKVNPPTPGDRGNDDGARPGGTADTREIAKELQGMDGKKWGELSGEVKSKLTMQMRAKYGEDYARMIKHYFEQLAKTPKK